MNRLIVAGLANYDITARCSQQYIPQDSNIGKITASYGGVGFNILRNLAHLGLNPEFVSVISDDIYGRGLVSYCNENGIDISHCQIIENSRSSQYISIENCDGEMMAALCDSDIVLRTDMNKVTQFLATLDEKDLLVIDCNYTQSQIEEMVNSTKAQIFIDPISTAKAQRTVNILSKTRMLKPNRYEAQYLCNAECKEEKDWPTLLKAMLETGLQEVAVTLSSEGVIASNGKEAVHVSGSRCEVKSVSGAGDGFISGYIYGCMKGYNFTDSLVLATSLSSISLQSEESINPQLSEQLLLDTFNRLKNELTVRKIQL